MKVFVYKVWFKEEPKTVYIGVTTNLKKRMQNHLCDTAKTRKTNWLNSQLKRGFELTYSVIHTAFSESEAFLSERQIIAYYRSEGYILKNSTEGGEGMLGKVWSEESKAKISAANKRRIVKDSTRKKISDSIRGENHPMYGKRGVESPNYGRRFTEKSKALISEALTGKPKSSAAKANMSAAHCKNTYELVSPTGEKFTTNNLRAFSQEHSISQGGLYTMISGKISSIKGWTGRKI